MSRGVKAPHRCFEKPAVSTPNEHVVPLLLQGDASAVDANRALICMVAAWTRLKPEVRATLLSVADTATTDNRFGLLGNPGCRDPPLRRPVRCVQSLRGVSSVWNAIP